MDYDNNGHGVALAEPETALEGPQTDEEAQAPTDGPAPAPKKRAARAAKPAPIANDEPEPEERPTAIVLREAKAAADTARRKVTAAHALRVQAKRTWLDAEATYRRAVTDRKRLADAELRAWEANAAAEVADVR